MTRAEWNTVVAFGVTVSLWLLPSVVGGIAGSESAIYEAVDSRLNEGVVAVLGASLLFVLPTNWARREATISWPDAARIDWGTILLFGAGLVFGAMLNQSGLAETIGQGLFATMGVSSVFAITAVSVLVALLI